MIGAYAKPLSYERQLSKFIPYSSHVTSNTIITRSGELMRIYKVRGIEFETADELDIAIPKETINTTLRAAGSRVAYWQHTVQRKKPTSLYSEFNNDFAYQLDARYQAKMLESPMHQNEHYLTVLYRPETNGMIRGLNKFGRSKSDLVRQQNVNLKEFDEIAQQLESSLSMFGMTSLEVYEDDAGVHYSEALSFLNFLISGKWQPVRLPDCALYDYLGNAQVIIGTETIEIRGPDSSHYSQIVELKDYSAKTQPGILNALYYHPFEWVLTQSFSPFDKHDGEKVLKRQQNYLERVEDGSSTQIAQIELAIDQLIDGHFIMGEYHFELTLFADTIEQVRSNTTKAISDIKDAGFMPCTAGIATDSAFYSTLPGNWEHRPIIANLTSRNFASLACMHSFESGKRNGNPWGDAITIFNSPSNRPIYFNMHDATNSSDQFGELLSGSVRVIGMNGVGKTVFDNFLLAQLQKFNNGRFTTLYLDNKQGAKPLIEALGGVYQTVKTGEPTGWNPFQMKPTEANMLFLDFLVTYLVTRGGHTISVADEQRISNAVRTVMKLPKNMRRPSMLLQSITEGHDTQERSNSIAKRFAKWCEDDGSGKRGTMAWVFDNETDCLDFTAADNFGIDGTDFLDNEEARTPITMYLLHRSKEVLDGRRFVQFMEEAWKWLDDEAFMESAGEHLATIRSKNGVLVLATQSPSTVLKSAISAQLIEQIATEVYLPNPRASKSDYVEGFKLTEHEFYIIRSFPKDSRHFLIKQGDTSRVAYLDLHGMGDYLEILSGRQP